MIIEFNDALIDIIETALPGVTVYGNFSPRADLTDQVIARLRFTGFTRQDHRLTQSSVTQSWGIDLQADQARADADVAEDMDGYIDDLIGALLGAQITDTFDGIKIDGIAAGINEAESAMQYTLNISFNAVIRRS
jgi:hypothetical protein